MRLLVLEAVVAGDVAFRRRKKNNAEDSATHCVSLSVQDRVSGLRTASTGQVPTNLVRSRLNDGKELLYPFTRVCGIRPLEITAAWLLPRTGRAFGALLNEALEMILDKLRRRDFDALERA